VYDVVVNSSRSLSHLLMSFLFIILEQANLVVSLSRVTGGHIDKPTVHNVGKRQGIPDRPNPHFYRAA